MIKALRLTLSALAIILMLFACKGKDEAIPAYIHVDSVTVTASGLQGNRVHDITAVQVFVDGDMLGVFELPATIPALYSGKHTVSFIAVTFINGSLSQRAVYSPLTIASAEATFTPGKVTTLNTINFVYRTSTNFLWTEDFEDANSTLIMSHAEAADSSKIQTVPFELRGNYTGNTKAMVIKMKGADTAKYIDMISFNTFSGLPVNGSPIHFEFDIKTPVNVQIALERINGAVHEYVPYLLVNGDDSRWKRFYLNMVEEIASQPASNTYKIYFTIRKPASVKNDVTVYIDNIRFCYLP